MVGSVIDRTLRWMKENLDGAYNARYSEGHEKSGQHCTNSGTCLLICCYINILGKVLCKGGPDKKVNGKRIKRDRQRFLQFAERCMPDLVTKSSAKTFPQIKQRPITGQEFLYEIFRCGFVHQFYPNEKSGWSRFPGQEQYWKEATPDRVVLNIDEFKRGFDCGVVRFREIAEIENDLRENFREYLLKE